MKAFFTLLFITLLLNVHGQATVDWFNYPNGVSVALDASNNVYTAYWDYNPAGDITLTKRNASGVVLWNAKFDNTDNTRHEVATWVEVDNNGDILVSGTIRSGYSNPVNAASVLMKFNTTGTLLWRVVYENSFDGSSTTKCLVDAVNNIYVLGIGTGPNGQVTKVKKFNSSGATVWNYFDAGIGAPVNFKFTPDNNILIVHRGITGSINGFSKIDLNGNNILSLAGFASLTVGDAAADAGGNSYLINGATGGSVLTKVSPAGTTIWTRSLAMIGSKVEVGTDNNPVIGGYPAAGFGVVMMKYDNNGNFLWQNLDADGPSLSLLALTPMRLDASNAAYIAGSTMSAMGMCKVNSSGVSQWAVTTPSGYPVWFDFGTDGNVYVTGGTTARIVQSAAACGVPAGMSTSNITTVSATFNWNAVANATSYVVRYRITGAPNWILQIVNGPSTSVNITGLVSFVNYEWQVQAICQTASDFSASVNFTTVCTPVPATITGSTTLCTGTSNLLSANSGAGLTYQWLLNNVSIPGATNATYLATVAGSYSCLVTSACGFSSSNVLVLTSLSVPATPGAISGQMTGVCGGIARTYAISPVNTATAYTWSVPAGTTFTGQGSVSINVNYPTNFTNGTITVTAFNSCGTSAARTTAVTGAPATPANIVGPTTACTRQTLSYSTPLVLGTTSYTWTVPTGATIQSGQGTNAVSVRFRNASGNVSVRANNTCGSSAYRSLAVSVTSCRRSTAKMQDNVAINIFPNPTAEAFRIAIAGMDAQSFDLVVADLSGRVVEKYSRINASGPYEFGKHLKRGVYIATVLISDTPVTMKLIKQ